MGGVMRTNSTTNTSSKTNKQQQQQQRENRRPAKQPRGTELESQGIRDQSTQESTAGELQKPSPGQLSCSGNPHRRMKISVAASSLLLLLFITITLGSKTEPSSRGPYHPAECCFNYVIHKVPRSRIAEYYETSSHFITRRGISICADPREDWVQDYITDLEEK
ncbi:C-C motif chemokine 14 [Galemys pyrenaicus]|uniref:C-C motif chemokine 14 n=1 Tax=Galemys pyrenaicus TaxID=202257 RepID=A0A8J6B6D3_GALPY|nr:C-C motif chemokine 14 [Galemys pyrenaicus]